MKPCECEFEEEALAAALQGRWPDRVDGSLHAHIESCVICADIVTIAGAIDDAREEMRASAVVPDSGRVWWLAQLRARRENAKTAGSPITAAQVIAFSCAIGLIGACFGATSTWFQSALRWIGSSVAGIDGKAFLLSAATLWAEHWALVLATALMLFLVPAAVFLALGRD